MKEDKTHNSKIIDEEDDAFEHPLEDMMAYLHSEECRKDFLKKSNAIEEARKKFEETGNPEDEKEYDRLASVAGEEFMRTLTSKIK